MIFKNATTPSTIASIFSPMTTPIPLDPTPPKMRYKILISFEIDVDISDINTEMKGNIRNDTAKNFKVDISRISVIEFFEKGNPRRRLLALQVQFTIFSASLIESQNIENDVSIEKINAILKNNFNDTIVATNIGITSSYDPGEKPISSENPIFYVIACIIGFLFIIFCLYIYFNQIVQRPFKPGSFDIHRCSYCECRSNNSIPSN